MLLFRNAKTREIMVGAEDKVEQCQYVAVISRVEDDLANELTGGWKVMEVCNPSANICSLLTRPLRWLAGQPEHICRALSVVIGWMDLDAFSSYHHSLSTPV